MQGGAQSSLYVSYIPGIINMKKNKRTKEKKKYNKKKKKLIKA